MQTETYSFEKQLIKRNIAGKLKRHFGTTPEEATLLQLYKAVSLTVRDEIMETWQESNSKLFL